MVLIQTAECLEFGSPAIRFKPQTSDKTTQNLATVPKKAKSHKALAWSLHFLAMFLSHSRVMETESITGASGSKYSISKAV